MEYQPGAGTVLRDILVLELLFGTGIRVSELCALSPQTVQLGAHKLRLLIHGKGQKERVIQIDTPELLELMRIYYQTFGGKIQVSSTVLFNNRGRALSPQSVRRIIRKYLRKLPEQYAATPHMFRHTFATMALQNGVDVKTVSSMLGHYSAGFTLDTYAHVTTDAQLKAAQTMGSILSRAV